MPTLKKPKCTSSAVETFFEGVNRSLSFLSGLSVPPSQFLTGTHELSKLVLARMALLMDQSDLVLLLQSANVRELGEVLWEICTRTPSTFPFKLSRASLFLPARTDKEKGN